MEVELNDTKNTIGTNWLGEGRLCNNQTQLFRKAWIHQKINSDESHNNVNIQMIKKNSIEMA